VAATARWRRAGYLPRVMALPHTPPHYHGGGTPAAYCARISNMAEWGNSALLFVHACFQHVPLPAGRLFCLFSCCACCRCTAAGVAFFRSTLYSVHLLQVGRSRYITCAHCLTYRCAASSATRTVISLVLSAYFQQINNNLADMRGGRYRRYRAGRYRAFDNHVLRMPFYILPSIITILSNSTSQPSARPLRLIIIHIRTLYGFFTILRRRKKAGQCAGLCLCCPGSAPGLLLPPHHLYATMTSDIVWGC